MLTLYNQSIDRIDKMATDMLHYRFFDNENCKQSLAYTSQVTSLKVVQLLLLMHLLTCHMDGHAPSCLREYYMSRM